MAKKGKKVAPNIYEHPDGKEQGFIAVANVAYVDAGGNKKYRRPEKIFLTVTKAFQWLEDQRSDSRKGLKIGVLQNPSLREIIDFTNPMRETKTVWVNIRCYRTVMMEYFGENRRLLTIEETDYIGFQSWLLSRFRMNGKRKGDTRTLSVGTVNKYCKELNWVLRFARKKNMIREDIEFPLMEENGSRPFEIDLADFLKCLEFLPQHKAMLMVALNTGGRKMDVFEMTKDRIVTRIMKNETTGKLEPQTFITIRSSKTKKDNIQVPLLEQTKVALEHHQQKQNGFLNSLFHSLTTTNPTPEDHTARERYEKARTLLAQKKEKIKKSKCPYTGVLIDLKPREKVTQVQDLNPSSFLFLSPETLCPFTDIQWAIESATKKAQTARFTMHVIRHLATTVLLDLTNGDVDLVQRIVGWSNRSMLMIYGHLGHRHIKTFSNFDSLLEKTRKGIEKNPNENGSKMEKAPSTSPIRLLPSPDLPDQERSVVQLGTAEA